MNIRMIICAAFAVAFLCSGAALAQDPLDGGFSIPLDYGQLIATMGEQNDSLRGAIFDWFSDQDSILQLSDEVFPDGIQCGDDRDFASADFNGDGMDEIVMAWSRSDGSVFIGIPTYDLINMVPLFWHMPDPPVAAGVLYATDTLAEVLGEIRVVAGNFYDDAAMEFVLAYLAADSTVTITVFDVDTSTLVPEAKGSISDQAIHTEMPEVQRFGTASRFDIVAGDLDNDGTDELVLIANDPAQSPETDQVVNIYDYETTGHTVNPVSQHPWTANLNASEVSCLRRIVATTGDFDADDRDEIAFIDDWARSDEDTLHWVCMHFLDYSADMLSIADSWDQDSTGFAHLNPIQSLNDNVFALTEYNGELIAGGEFTNEDGGSTPLNRIARWDGTAWRPFGSGFNHIVLALAVYNGDLIAGGYFTGTEDGGVTAYHIARWDGSEWHALGGGMGDNVRALTVYNDDLIVGGEFNNADWDNNPFLVNKIARWDGSEWHALGGGMGNKVHALTVYNDDLIVGGEFNNADWDNNPFLVYKIARWDGSEWHALGGGMGNNVRALTVYNDDLIVGGDFNNADWDNNPFLVNKIARWDGSAWDSLGAGFDSTVWSLTTFNFGSHGEVLVAGGGFKDFDIPDAFFRLAWFDDDDPHWSPFQQDSSGAFGTVRALTEYDGDLILGGLFVELEAPFPGNLIPSKYIGRVKPEGDGVFDTLRARSDFIVDIVSDDVDFAPDGADEIIVRAYHDPSPFYGPWKPAVALRIYGVDGDFDGCCRSGNSFAGVWGVGGVHGSRRTMAVGDFVDDENNYKDLLLLRANPDNPTANNLSAFGIDTTVLAPCSSPGGPDLPLMAERMDRSGTIAELITADLDTATIELRAPTYYHIDSIIQPLVVLNVPPVHVDWDAVGDTIWDVSNRYPWPPHVLSEYRTYCAYGNRQEWVTAVSSVVRKDWGISTGLKTRFSSCGYTVKAHLNTQYGEGFSEQGTNSTTLSVLQVKEAHADDMILASSIDYDIWEYPVYRRGERLVGGDVVVVDPSDVRKVWINGKDEDTWISDHEVENIFSYARYSDLADNPMVASDGVIQLDTWPMSPTAKGPYAIKREEFQSSSVEESNNFGVEVGASLSYKTGLSFFGLGAKFGIQVSVEGTYSKSELNTYSTTFTTADSLHVQLGYINSSGSFEGNRSYEITPYAYWAKNGALVLDYAVNPLANDPGEDPTWWQIHYSSPDPAFILPWRLDPEKDGSVANENRYKTREIVFIPSYPSPGDTVLIIARVHNFSLNPTLTPVKVSFYLGDPDVGGTLLNDKNTNDCLFYACDVDGVPTVIQGQGEAAAQMVWTVPMDASIAECQRIWALIDPLDEITPEVHDNDAEITNNKGWNRLDVNTTNECYDPDGDGLVASAYRCCEDLPLGDNCPNVYNPLQEDSDGDGIGDACQFAGVCGNANGDDLVNIGDAVFLIAYIFRDGQAPDPVCIGDANADGLTNVGDAVYLINYIFREGQPPNEGCCP